MKMAPLLLLAFPLWANVLQDDGCDGTDASPTPEPTPDFTPEPTPDFTPDHTPDPTPNTPTPPDDTEPRPEEALSSVSALRLDIHGHPYTRTGDGEIVYDGGADLDSATSQNNMASILASVKTEGYDETVQGQAMLEVTRRYPQVVPLLWCSPGHGGSADNAETFLSEHQFAGLKFHPTIDELPADSPLMDPYLDVAASHQVPVVIHTAEDAAARPELVANLAARHPDVTIILYHSGLGTNQEAAIEVARLCPNCILETSWVPFDKVLELEEQIGSDRVVFGSDATVDGAGHYENSWGSGVGDGSYDAQLVALGRELSRADYRALMVHNTLRFFHLVTVHSYRPLAREVAIRFDNGNGYGEAFPMLSEGNGWWRRMLPSVGSARFDFYVDGEAADGIEYESNDWEIWQKDSALLDAPPTTTIRAVADVGYGHSLFLRGASWPASWEVGEPMTWSAGNVWTLELEGLVAPIEFKLLIDDAEWESGDNHSVQPGETVTVSPNF